MQSDEVVWVCINQGHCSFRTTSDSGRNFCRNEYNLNGLCLRSSCPLANARYATVREHEGKCYLYIKTPERAHLPRELWEKIELSSDYEEALKQIDEHLRHWPAHLIHKNKQRLTKIHQYLIRMRTLQLQVQPKLIGRKLKIQRREKRREAKALQAAKIEGTLRRELQARLHSNEFDDVINYPQKVFDDVLDSVEEDVEEKDSEEEYEDEEEEEFVEGESEEEMEEELEYEVEEAGAAPMATQAAGSPPKRRRGHVSIQFES